MIFLFISFSGNILNSLNINKKVYLRKNIKNRFQVNSKLSKNDVGT